MFAARRESISSIDSDEKPEYESDSESQIAAREAKEWEESLQQLELVVSVFLIPALGKWLGRRWSIWLATVSGERSFLESAWVSTSDDSGNRATPKIIEHFELLYLSKTAIVPHHCVIPFTDKQPITLAALQDMS
ncbi:hypothetical protein FRC03_012412 [Tulasnella sp. 419]|nr:hypothetical protein FRC03_012412 [Tulasnella sp. 419]